MRYARQLYLLVATIAFGLALIIGYADWSSPFQSVESELKQVKQRLEEALRRLEAKKQTLKNKVQTRGYRSLLEDQDAEKYDYFIFENKELVFWSDYRFVPQYQNLSTHLPYQYRLLDQNEGQFLYIVTRIKLDDPRQELFVFLPLKREYKIKNTHLKSGYNPALIGHEAVQISSIKMDGYLPVYSPYEEFILGLSYQDGANVPVTRFWLGVVFLSVVGFVFLGLHIGTLMRQLEYNRNYELAWILLAIYLALLRFATIYFHFPISVFDWLIFNPKIYASSAISPSIGDLLINLVMIGILVYYALINCSRTHLYHYLLKMNVQSRAVVSVMILVLLIGVFNAGFYVLSTIFEHSKLNLDITRDFDFSWYSVIGILIFICTAIVGFFFIHLLNRLFLQINPKGESKITGIFLLAALIYSVVSYLLQDLYFFVVIFSLIFAACIHHFRLSRHLYRFTYLSFIYLLIGALGWAILGTGVIYIFGQEKSIEDKRRFAALLLPESDEFAEFLLSNARDNIEKDSLIRDFFQMENQMDSLKLIEQRIRKNYLPNYLDRYQMEILFFKTPGGQRISKAEAEVEGRYQSYRENYDKIYYETDEEDIYFISKSGVNLIKRYLVFVSIASQEEALGHIIIDLKQKRAEPTRVYPELLMDRSYDQSQASREYSYAIYDNEQLVYSVGNFNYEKNFDIALFDKDKDKLFIDGLAHNGYEHLAVGGGSTKRVVVSSYGYSFSDIFSNFSFLFLVLVICIVGFILVYSVIRRFQKVKVNFATRIQFYLNIAFFLPLFMVSITTLSVISSTYKEDFNQNFISKTESVRLNILPYLANLRKASIDTTEFASHLSEIAQHIEADVNIFDEEGRLLISSQPSIYETQLLSQWINPKAYYLIKEDHNNKVLLKESVGTLNYKSVYVPIKSYESYETGQLVGILSIPFFDSQYELNRKLVKVLSTILNIFASIFIIFIILSYFASQILTIPLRLITQKIKKTTFYNYNEPLEWNSRDEIGLFVEEYNKMLYKLDKSKEALVRSQKESAWREIAQQVAHEIKNPLTPMKLTLQYMQMRLQNQGEKIKSMFERSFDTLLTQVETLSDIATSFSSFAKMPIPISERFELAKVLTDSKDLYSNEDIDLILNLESGNYYVRGDKRLMGRIFTNLIKNAKEAVPEDRKPRVKITLSTGIEGLVLIEFQDNGTGISKEVQEKIFMPNFSTKSTGSGIGLAVAKRGIEHAGGRIWFETQEGQGTSFFIELPLVE